MITGNMTLHARPTERELKEHGICSGCGRECHEIGVDNSFDDAFGFVTDWAAGSNCCEAEVCKGRIYLNRTTIHTARKDHAPFGRKGTFIPKGAKYSKTIRKGYYVTEDGERCGVFQIEKRLISAPPVPAPTPALAPLA